MAGTQTAPDKITEDEWEKINDLFFKLCQKIKDYSNDQQECRKAIVSNDRKLMTDTISRLSIKYLIQINQISQYLGGQIVARAHERKTDCPVKSDDELRSDLIYIERILPLAVIVRAGLAELIENKLHFLIDNQSEYFNP